MDLKVTGPARRFETRSSEEHRTFARAPFARDDVDEVLGPETGKQAKKNLRIKPNRVSTTATIVNAHHRMCKQVETAGGGMIGDR
jgi:hypothetical protein